MTKPSSPRFPKKSAAAKLRVANQQRRLGKFTAGRIETTETRPPLPMLPPSGDVAFKNLFVAIPNPVSDLFYNPDEAFLSNQENASRMIQDMAIFSALQERYLASAGLPWSIVPEDAENPSQQQAAEEIETIIRTRMPNLTDFLVNLLWSIWFGRMAAYIDYEWDWSTGKRQLVPCGWTPVHGDTLVFGDDGRVGYRVGTVAADKDVIVGVPGRAVMVKEGPLVNGNRYLQPEQRKAWVVHHHQKTAGEFRIFTSAAAKYGLGLRSRLYPTWLLKQSVLQFAMNAAEKFGSGWVIGYFDGSNPASRDAVQQALTKQVGSCVQMFPRFAPEAEAIEGMEVIDPPSGVSELKTWVDYFDDQIRVTIAGQKMTADNEKGSGLGSNLADVQQSTFGRLVKYDSGALGETLSKQFVAVLQEFCGYDHLLPLKWEFSHDIGSTAEKLANAKTLHEIGVPLDAEELRQAAGFTAPEEGGENATGQIDTTGMEATNEIQTDELADENETEAEDADD